MNLTALRIGRGKDIFVHASALNRGGISELAEGQTVAADAHYMRSGGNAGLCPRQALRVLRKKMH
jgi:hypothetical protein